MSKKEDIHKPKEARLRIALPTGETQKCKVTGTQIHIGSGSNSEVQISDPEVSSTQAMIVVDGDSYSITDEGGGTFVNGEAITNPRRLSHGDVISMGKSRITFKLKHGDKAHKHHAGSAASAEVAAVQTGPSHDESKKKKDKRDEDRDERVKAAKVRAWGGIIGTVVTALLTITISIVMTRTGNQSGGPLTMAVAGKGIELANLSDSRKIKGGRFEASGAAAVPDANGILFVDDSRPDSVFYMPVNALGEQDGAVTAIALGVSVENPEGISQYGSRFMVTGSLSTNESNEQGGIAVFDFDPSTQTVSKVVVLKGMRKFLFDNVPELKSWADKTSIEGGLNVEGIAFDSDPQHPRVLLGLRGPVLNGNALIVPIRIRDRSAPLTIENLEMDEPNAIQLNLNGQAIRDIQYDSQLRSFLIISGAPETEEKTDFTLWQWNGEANQANEQARPKQQTLLDKKMKPEGISSLKISNHAFVFIVGDAGSYAKIEYSSP